MPFICKRRLVLAPLFLLVCGGVWLLLPPPSQSQEAGAGPDVDGSVVDEIRRLAIEGENPEAAILLATQYLEEHPETTLERQRVHYELATAQFYGGNNDAALATFTEIVALYANAEFDHTSAEYRVDDALYFIGFLKRNNGDRAAAMARFETLIERYPQSNRRPRAMLDLANLSLEDGKVEVGMRMLQAVAAQYPDTEFEPWAISDIIRWLLTPEISSNEQSRAENLAAAKANIDTLLAKYPRAPETRMSLRDLVWHLKESDCFDDAEAEVWARKLFAALAGDMDKFAAVESADVGKLSETLQELGRHDLASLVSGAHLLSGGDRDHLSSRQCAETVCGLVLSQVALAQAKDRQRVWDIGRLYVADSIDELSDGTFGILDGLAEGMESDPALAEAIMTDLAKRTQDVYDTLPKLERRLTALVLQRRIEEAPSDVQKSFWQAQQLQSKGDLAGATAMFRAIVDGPACPSDVKDALNRRIVALLLEQQTDLAALDKYLPALRRQGEELDAEAWNLSCRALFRRVAAAKDDRLSVWKNGLGALAARTIVVRRKTLEDLDKLTAFLGRDGGDFASTIVTDLLLCTPHGYSMWRLQWRRTAMFTEAADFDSARAAAAMDVVLAAASGQSVRPPLERFEEVLRSGGAAETDVAQTVGSFLCGSSGDAATQPAMRFVDEPLRKAAQEALRLAAGSDNPRRLAYLNLLAGNTDKALLAGRDRLLGCPSARQAAEALGDIYVTLAVADGGLASANRFTDWLSASSNETSGQTPPRADDKRLAILADGDWHAKTAASRPADGQPFASWSPEDRAAVARDFSGQLAEELVASAGSAMSRGNKALATGLWALTLCGTAAPDAVNAALDSMIESLRPDTGLPDIRRFLKDMLPLVPTLPHRRIVLVRMAGLAHEEQLFDDCLALLDEADALDTKARQKDFAAAMLRASAMLELDDYEGADELLAEVARWDGADEDKAQCLFVTACLRLKQGQMKDARKILQKLTDQYPRTSVATRAGQLAARLK